MVCFDTSIIVDILRGNIPSEILSDIDEEEIFIPAPVITEIIRGLYLKKSINNLKNIEREKTDKFLHSFVVLDFNKECALRAGEIQADLINNGEMIGLEDVLIASICIVNEQPIFTRNKKHFERIKGLVVEGY